ncbi:MAG TPA: 23S rRNA (uracil(1939)-C(5))-methyltransferase RlmD [Candidatus Peribacteria bacterium]|nr:23S rRNA (uracil(1939)-C(5))-methyltransferase RlmD [Candidatus Peribacteria bacterium]
MSTVTDPVPPAEGVHPGQQHTVTIEKFAHGGAGFATLNGMPVFVAGGIPGQRVQVVITKSKGNFAEAKVDKVLLRSKDEIMAKCIHFGSCGGCVWQNLSYNKQIQFKEDIVRETLEHLTPADPAVRKQLPGRVLKIIPSPQVFNYRNKLELTFGYGNMRVEEKPAKVPGGKPQRIHFDENPGVGFHVAKEWATILPVNECHLYDEQLPALLADVNRFMKDTGLPVYNPKTHRGMLRNLILRRGVHTNEHMICFVVQARKKELEPLFQKFMRFAGRPNLKSLLIVEHFGLNDKPEMPKIHTLVGEPSIRERLFDLTFDISPFSFFQTNTLATEKLYAAVASAADLSGRDTVLDAYCGMGTIGQYLARFCEKVVGIESHPSAIEDALKSAGRNRIGNISFYKGRAEQVLHSQLKPGGKYKFNVIVVDPPRVGLHADALESIITHRPEKIVYVSCNAATFARDLGELLKNGYELRNVQPVDMFPHTAHIELVASLHRK